MLQNKRKTIGVFAEKVKEEFQMRLCQGIIEEAELQGIMWQFLQIMESTDKIINILSVIK